MIGIANVAERKGLGKKNRAGQISSDKGNRGETLIELPSLGLCRLGGGDGWKRVRYRIGLKSKNGRNFKE